ncbi:MAG: alpha/beta hydrolase [Candidatus Cryptobacteroides sp.]
MKKIFTIAAAILFGISHISSAQDKDVVPDGTYLYAQKDSCELFMDIYNPAKGSNTAIGGKQKPLIVFVFGGGFIGGRRDDPDYLPWFRMMSEDGYKVISIDYRLGLKGTKNVGPAQVNALDKAIHLAVEDLYSAIGYILDNADMLGVDKDNIVICGSSAGAITVLQADYELVNRTRYAEVLPEDFRFAGVMSFSGGILSRNGALKYKENPAPTLLVHGTADKLVNYKQIRFFNLGFFGSDKIAARWKRLGIPYSIVRFTDHGHEVAGFLDITTSLQKDFIEKDVLGKGRVTTDQTISDPSLKKGSGSQTRKELYGK